MHSPVHIKENSWFAALAARKMKAEQIAIVWRNTIHLHGTTREDFLQSDSWVLHELKHVEQYAANGWPAFLCKYLYYSFRHGYFNNPLEKEARDSERDYSLLEKYKIQPCSH
ncbi:DUF4157 domain-containing protein [Chitinophagaceae bacterium MMS25-I14]